MCIIKYIYYLSVIIAKHSISKNLTLEAQSKWAPSSARILIIIGWELLFIAVTTIIQNVFKFG